MGTSESRRKVIVIALGAAGLLLFLAFGAMNAFNLNFLNPSTTSQIVVFTGLSTLAFLIFVIVVLLLVRNVLKLYAEQRSHVMGTRLRTRMLWGAILISLIPIAFMFLFSYGLLNRAVDRWFSQDVTSIRDDANAIALKLAQYSSANARAEAESIAASLSAAPPAPKAAPRGKARKSSDRPNDRPIDATRRVLSAHEITLQHGFAVVYRGGHSVASLNLPRGPATAEVRPGLPDPAPANDTAFPGAETQGAVHVAGDLDASILAAAGRSDLPIFSRGGTDFALGSAALPEDGTVVVGIPMPYGMASTMTRLRTAAQVYWSVYRTRREVRTLYMLLLLVITSVAIFASSWLALHLSKQVTRPVEALADAMEAIAAGDYAHRVAASATDELGDLVRSFNRMAADLEGSRQAAESSNLQLSEANAKLEARRNELETMLETIPNGVATLDANRRIVLANRALSEMLDPGGQARFIGSNIEQVLPPDLLELVDRLLRRSHRMGAASAEVELRASADHADRAGGTLSLHATVALLESGSGYDRTHFGYVLVLEDATELLRAQKQSAWKEVARRVAHEIKNPLTPISLSAEQIHRHIARLADLLASHALDSASTQVIRRSSEVISSSVESMRSLVDQFSALAEFPAARPRPADLNTIVENSLAVFAGRLQGIRVVRRLSPGLPLVLADPEAMKRGIGNLIDNAAEAMQGSLLRELRLSTVLLPTGMVELTVGDTGPGLTDDMKERLFLPYFSTKQRGTGLGLAIAAKIVQEHQGTIRAEKNEPAGAKFIIELRAASQVDAEDSAQPQTEGELNANTAKVPA